MISLLTIWCLLLTIVLIIQTKALNLLDDNIRTLNRARIMDDLEK